jgi:hypothetical protein
MQRNKRAIEGLVLAVAAADRGIVPVTPPVQFTWLFACMLQLSRLVGTLPIIVSNGKVTAFPRQPHNFEESRHTFEIAPIQ